MERLKKTEIDLQREISFIINSKLKDPSIGFVTVTDVKLSSDYHYLDIFISVMGDDEKINQSLLCLKNCEGFIKNNLKKRFRLKTMPELKFIYDKSIDYGIKVTELLEDLKKKNRL